ncbi:MAG: GUN4 domain-containing protein, partial [Cyanobacteriota bacterium]|nr:GUN4 domain-containing protein [Cyanobacteriota bacterium]
LGSMATAYGTLTHIDLSNYLESDNQDIIYFYGELLGFYNNDIERKKKLKGYIEALEITINPENLNLYSLPNSLCESAIIEGDKLKSTNISNNSEATRFDLIQEQISKIINDGVGSLEVIDINGEPASIDINLLTDTKTCIRKPIEMQQLEELLQAKKWKEADLKTYDAMLKVSNRKAEGNLDPESIQNFSCSYLETIDRLWTRYSGGQFGLSVQKQIYQKTGNNITTDFLRKYDPDAYIHFNDLVRWIETQDNGKEVWKPYDQLTFSLDAPTGHLPRLEKLEAGMEQEPGYKFLSPNSLPLTSQEIQARNLLFSRVKACEL